MFWGFFVVVVYIFKWMEKIKIVCDTLQKIYEVQIFLSTNKFYWNTFILLLLEPASACTLRQSISNMCVPQSLKELSGLLIEKVC